MTNSTFTPEEAAPLVGMAASTIRLWCKTYAVGLSDGANPPPGTERRLTTQDVATLQQVKVWRDDRIPTNEIVTLLQAAASRNEPAPLTIDVTPASSQNDTASHSDDLPHALVLSSHQSQIDALRADFRMLQRDVLWWGRLEGAIAALVAGAFVLWLLYLVG